MIQNIMFFICYEKYEAKPVPISREALSETCKSREQ